MNKLNSRRIAFYGVLSALMFVFLLIETYLFTAFFGNFTPAILTLPFAVALSLFNKEEGMWLGGTIFGCCSFFLAVCIANPIFLNPLISIFPRVFIGVIAYIAFSAVSAIFKNSQVPFLKEKLPQAVGGALGILTNTIFTIFMINLFHSEALVSVISTILSINFLAEIIGAIILVPIYTNVLKRIKNKLWLFVLTLVIPT